MPNSSKSSSSTHSMDAQERALLICGRANDLLSLIGGGNNHPDIDACHITTEDHQHTEHCSHHHQSTNEAVDHHQHTEHCNHDDDDKIEHSSLQKEDEDEEEGLEAADDEDQIIDEAKSLFNQALSIDQGCIDALIGLSFIAGLDNDDKHSEDLLNRAEALAPGDQRIHALRDALKEKIERAERLQRQSEEQESGNGGDDLEGVLEVGNVKDVPFLFHKGSATKKFIVTLRQIFDRFDANKDNSLSLKELQAYSMAVNGQQLDKQTVQFLLHTYNSDKRGLTFTGFVELYINQTIEDPSETFKDLSTLGFDATLSKKL
ncbi:hypothetical protein SAMD00019534_027650, partial [Acytostelium subglobosum LB1]|uniref:hypothetical protein n=1 Tax=Acytostelium subglobosum LB1 TaxID=1410327 RepID=UPI000644B4D0